MRNSPINVLVMSGASACQLPINSVHVDVESVADLADQMDGNAIYRDLDLLERPN